MIKLISLFLLVLFQLSTSMAFAEESLVVVGKDGGVSVKVLSAEDSVSLVEDENLTVKRIASQGSASNSNIIISKNNDKVNLQVGMDKSLDVTNWKDNLVEVEARADSRLVRVSNDNGNFLISEENVTASTDLPIIIDPLNGKFLIETIKGRKYLSILPMEAVRSILKTRFINRIGNERVKIVSDDLGLNYLIKGEKVINILNVYDLKLPVSALVSAETGEVKSILEPSWLKFISVIFV